MFDAIYLILYQCFVICSFTLTEFFFLKMAVFQLVKTPPIFYGARHVESTR